ncbi:MAG: hypothetical protein A2Y13_02910 [Planctomycetes bacterium GWC2_45_44]|nr:MAG: hypothetical protein A2Y13_02910 [Planctomycetes bacterium GWC2_45_44]HBR19389.1 hypothetical protein [Phycisphaerales bacterium]
MDRRNNSKKSLKLNTAASWCNIKKAGVYAGLCVFITAPLSAVAKAMADRLSRLCFIFFF